MITNKYEKEAWADDLLLLGVDEAGYGNLFGSLFIAGVLFSKGYEFDNLPGLRDSKFVKDAKRFELEILIKDQAKWWFCEEVSPEVIDAETGYHAKYRAAKEAINANENLDKSTIVLMDGNVAIGGILQDSRCLIKGDSLSKTIAAASILAKCAQRSQIKSLAAQYHEYDIGNNNGYWSKKHVAALKKFGPTKHHRRSYIKKIC